MKEFLIGTGGWGYFPNVERPSLTLYSKIFNFVEVNNTFYQFPPNQTIEKWRLSVPASFTFSVRCHQDLTHKIGLKGTNQAYEIIYKMKTYCDMLRSPYLVLETPARYVINQEIQKETKDFFSTLNLGEVRIVWEYRGHKTSFSTGLMQDLGIIECVDLSKQKPSHNLDVTYSRLFGKGKHNIYQFTDDEIVEIDRKAQETNSKTIILSYHGTRMITDAARHLQYKRTGEFLPVTSFTGLNSAKAVLSEDAKFPATKKQLTIDQGWKVIDISKEKRIHLSQVLTNIPDKTYSSLEELIKELKAVF